MKHTGADIELVLGVSSAGKSNYIRQRQAQGTAARVVMAYEITNSTAPGILDAGPCIVHYNMLRPYDNDADQYHRPLHADPVLAHLLARASRITGTVLVARPSLLAKRTLLRGEIEALRPLDEARYPTALIFEFLSRVPAADIYERWFALLSESGIPFRILSAESEQFQSILSLDEARQVLRIKEPVAYAEAEKRTALSRFTFAYQWLDAIAAGAGANRQPTLEAILPFLVGNTALDIGCGPGFFCFVLERMGFREVVGTEIKRDRFQAACALGAVTGSRCEFLMRDILAGEPLPRQFDTVLMLNVLHHVRDPIGALHRAADTCKGRLIIEFATTADQKFASTFTGDTPKDHCVPLIGVSLLSAQDQTFLFSQEALRRICLDHAGLFSSMEFTASPVSPSRRIAICSK